MDLLENSLYNADIKQVITNLTGWEKLHNKTILISGATGMIGRFLIDTLMFQNEHGLCCHIVALGRNLEKAKQRFKPYWNDSYFDFITCDINFPISNQLHIDYIIHAASNTHPVAYATDPIGTISANIIGTYNLLNLAAEKEVKKFLFLSSVEIYGENRGDTKYFNENYCGYIDCNSLRAGYPESKRTGEALCQAFIKATGLPIVIPRLARTFGPTMLNSDTKAISQFIKKGVARENVVLKSEGNQLYSYTYVADAVSGILFCLFKGECGEAYNIANDTCNITLRDLAQLISNHVGTTVVFDIPDETEMAGYSKATLALLDNKKIRKLGWQASFDMYSGICHTLDILSQL